MATDIQQLNIEDGEYTIEVSLEGGSGRASITSPCVLEVSGKEGCATIIWSSPNYDYMIVGDEKYLPVNDEGNSTFEIPVLLYDGPMMVTADTTAMSVPHEIEYNLTFDSTTIVDATGNAVNVSDNTNASSVYHGILIAAVVIAGIAYAKKRLRGKKTSHK